MQPADNDRRVIAVDNRHQQIDADCVDTVADGHAKRPARLLFIVECFNQPDKSIGLHNKVLGGTNAGLRAGQATGKQGIDKIVTIIVRSAKSGKLSRSQAILVGQDRHLQRGQSQ